MTLKFNNIYIKDSAVVAGPFLKDGPLAGNFDLVYQDFYDSEATFEDCEIKELNKSVEILLNKTSSTINEIDVLLSSDLTNQIAVSNIVAGNTKIPYMGIYSACASFTEEIIIGSSLLNNNNINNVMCLTSSHNLTAERQFRSPIEYGSPKPNYSTFTVSAATSCLLTKEKNKIMVDTATIGRVIDLGIKDSFDMGSSMAPAAADTLHRHLKETGRKEDYYDLILTGDLGIYGKKIFKTYCNIEYGYKLDNYNDSATLVYDMNNSKVQAGGSGPSCLPVYLFSKVIPEMINKKIKRVLLLATGALLSTTTVNQKKTIPCICHAVSLEVV